MSQQAKDFYEFGDFKIDSVERVLLREGEPVPLTPKVFDLLLLLVESHGHVIEKEKLMNEIWPGMFVEEGNLTQNISVLRKILDDGEGHQYIQTIPRRGYRFVGRIRTMAEVNEELIVEEHLRSKVVVEQSENGDSEIAVATNAQKLLPPVAKASWRSKRSVLAVGAGLFVLVIGGLLWWSSHKAGQPVLTEKDTILLADFDNKTGDQVFDGTLKQALAVQLQQTPFLNLFPEDGVRATLRYMGHSPDEHVTREVGREICERQGLKAMLIGTIASFGRNYVITVEAINGQTGGAIVSRQGEAEGKEQVLRTLQQVVTELRERLGESLPTIEKYNTPLEQATTSSLDALKAFSMAMELSTKGKLDEVIPFLKRAVELDPNFALAYVELADVYEQTGQRELAIETGHKAFDLRERVSEREKLAIAGSYYLGRTGEQEKAIEVYELLIRTYPRDWYFWNNVGWAYVSIGQFDKAVERFREAIRLYPNVYSYSGLATSFLHVNRFNEAKAILDQALVQNPDRAFYHACLYAIAFINRDEGAMQQQIDWASARPNEFIHLIWQGDAAAFSGQLRKAREFYQRGVEIEQLSNKEDAANDGASIALREVVSGNCRRAKEDVGRSLAIAHSDGAMWVSAAALALCGENAQAQPLIDETAKRNPKDTVINAVSLPVARAAIEIRRNNPGRAIELLQPAKAYVGANYDETRFNSLWAEYVRPEYLRGLAYLNQREGAEAAAEFQTILDHRGLFPTSIQYPLARLGMARAAAVSGDVAKARKYYQDFFALWKDADADLPMLVEAKKEYEKLK